MVMSALSCLWDNPDTCPQVRVDGVTGRRYCRMCGPEPVEVYEARIKADAEAGAPEGAPAAPPDAA